MSSNEPSSNVAEHLIGPPVPLDTTRGRKDYSFPSSSLMVPYGHPRSCDDALIELDDSLDDSLDEEIAQLTNALGEVGI